MREVRENKRMMKGVEIKFGREGKEKNEEGREGGRENEKMGKEGEMNK